MNFICDKNALIDGINTVIKALTSKAIKPEYEGIYIESFEDKIELVASNEKMSIRTFVKAIVNIEGKILINGRIFSDLIKKCYDGDIECKIKDNSTLNILSGKSKVQIPLIDVTSYPIIDIGETQWQFTLENKILKDMIKGSIFATADENSSNPVLTGVYCECENGNISFIAIDGYRMAIKKTKVNGNINGNVNIPKKTLDEIYRIINDEDFTEIVVCNKYIKAVSNDITIISTILEGEYVNYKQILPSTFEIKIKIKKEDIFLSIDRASIISRAKKDNLLLLDIDKDVMIITAKSEYGDIYDELDIYQEGKPLKIGFNGSYLNDVFKNVDCDEVFMEFNSDVSPCVIKKCENSDFIYLVLPVKIK